MNMTFMIGNGFDLACGLKTRYTDVYEVYCKTDSKNENISSFKKEILGGGSYENWTDFEMALPGFGEKINDFDKFEECVLDFTEFLDEYLKEQEKRLNIDINKVKVGQSMENYIYRIYNYCLLYSKTHLHSVITNTLDSCICNFITFNYTNTLEKCLSPLTNPLKKSTGYQYQYQYQVPKHIHEELNNGILLGLDDENLYKNIPCPDIRRLKNLIDKVHINSRSSNITNQSLEIIKSSNVIVIFGWSMGDSDSFWVNSIKEVFSKNENLNLVFVPYYKEPINKKLRNQPLDREDESKDFIIRKLGASETDVDRIHIVIDSNYMDLKFISSIPDEKEENVEELITA